MRLHPRTLPVQRASAVIRNTLWALQEEHGLTYAEMLLVLGEHQRRISTQLLRDERHPDEPDRKADEE